MAELASTGLCSANPPSFLAWSLCSFNNSLTDTEAGALSQPSTELRDSKGGVRKRTEGAEGLHNPMGRKGAPRDNTIN